MRPGISKVIDGKRIFDIAKIIGGSYGNGWFTNTRDIRYRIWKGSRSSKKSKNILGYEIIIKIISDPKRNILVVRKNDSDHRESTYANLIRCIYDLGLEDYFTCTKQPLNIVYNPTGQIIMFRGLNNPTSLNSIAVAVGYLSDVYIEESFEIDSYDAFVKLDQSVRVGKDYDENGVLMDVDLPQQVTLILNAWSKDHWIYTEFFKGRLEDPEDKVLEERKYVDYTDKNFVGPAGTGLYLCVISYLANEFRDDKKVDKAALEMKKKNVDYYGTLFLGKWGNVTSSVYGRDFNDTCIISPEQAKQYKFIWFSLGSDAGFTHSGVEKHKVKKNENPDVKVRSATTLCLTGVTENYNDIVAIDEYFHSNVYTDNEGNTDDREDQPMHVLADRIVETVAKWCRQYGGEGVAPHNVVDYGLLMRGEINIFCDIGDQGFMDMLRLKFRNVGMFNVNILNGPKTPIQGRVDFERLMLSYGHMKVCSNCKNLIREFRAARKGEKGEARMDGNDHVITAFEYSWASIKTQFTMWKRYLKEH